MRNHHLFVVTVLILLATVLYACGGETPATQSADNTATMQLAEVDQESKDVEGHVDEGDEIPDAEEMHTEDEEGHHDEDEEAHHGEGEDAHEEEDHDEHMADSHGVPEEASAMANPIANNQESIDAGAALYAENCAVCHGETGLGDGAAAAGLEPKPPNLHENHVQELTDGGLFHIITHGRPKTAMPAWEDALSEEERWHAVNFLRTFRE